MNDNQTTELCKLLDERGVEYETDERNAITKWSTHYGAFVFFARQREGKLLVETTVATEHSVILTPEQAIAATLGGGKPDDKSRWYELFGTPERAARTIAAIGGRYPCDESAQDCDACPLNGAPCRLNRDKPEESKLLEWLREETK